MTIATQATLAALLAKTLTAPATEAKQDTANTALAGLHTDLTGTLTTRVTGTTVTGTLTSGASTVDGSTDLTGYSSVSVQLTGTFGLNAGFQTSNDGTTWVAKNLTSTAGAISSTVPNTAVIYYGDIGARYFRVNVSSYTSGTATVTIHYSSAPSTVPTQLIAGSATIGAVSIGAATPSKITATSAATTNATSSKASAGSLYEISVSNPSAAAVYLKLYNKASAPTVGTDVPVITIPIAATGYVCLPLGVTGKRFTTGIAWALTGAFAATDTTAIAAGVQIDGTYV